MSTDQELFDAATSNEPMQDIPAEPVGQPEPQPAIARDDAGRFAAKPDDAPSDGDPAPPGEPKEPPPHRFREVSERARAAEARAAELERLLFQRVQPEPVKPTEPAPKVEMWDNPEGFVTGFIDPVKQELAESLYQTREFYSRREAVREHGAEKVNEAVRVFSELVNTDKDHGPNAVKAIKASLDPIGEILKWHDQYQERQDPELARKRAVERMLADPAQRELVSQMLNGGAPAPQTQSAGNQPSGSIVKLPPNLNRMTSAASNKAAGDDVSDQELFHATTSRRR